MKYQTIKTVLEMTGTAIKEILIGASLGVLVGCIWGFGYMQGERRGLKRYEWTNEDLRTDITNCRTTLNQCKKDLADPHHCVSVCVEAFEKYGC